MIAQAKKNEKTVHTKMIQNEPCPKVKGSRLRKQGRVRGGSRCCVCGCQEHTCGSIVYIEQLIYISFSWHPNQVLHRSCPYKEFYLN